MAETDPQAVYNAGTSRFVILTVLLTKQDAAGIQTGVNALRTHPRSACRIRLAQREGDLLVGKPQVASSHPFVSNTADLRFLL
jgi:hypothetical protein